MNKKLLENNLKNLEEELNLCRYAVNKYSKENIVEPNEELYTDLYRKKLKLSIRFGKIKTELNKVESEIEQYLDNENKYKNFKIYNERIPMLEYLIKTLEGVLNNEEKRN